MSRCQYRQYKNVTYAEAWDIQTSFHEKLKAEKKNHNGDDTYEPLHQLIFCEHDPVYTLGKSGKMDHLLLTEDGLAEQKIEFFKINRGGDITYHGPGQITGYPIFDMDDFYHDIRRYVRDLEDIMIELLAMYDIRGERIEEYTGVWIKDRKPYRKICAIGVHMSRWVTLHGFALNVSTDLSYFHNIVPCGIRDVDKGVTSLSREVGRELDINTVMQQLKSIFASKFNLKYVE